jgi:hypothetical protein
VRAAIRTFRKAERSAIAKIAAGTVAFTVATLTGARALTAIGGIASARVRVTAYKAGYRHLQLGVAGAVAADLISGATAEEGFSQSTRNHEQLNTEVEKCKARFSQAFHDTMRIMISTPW